MLCVELHPLLTHLHRGLESPKMNTFHDISQCLQEIIIDHKKMNTKEKVILWHTNRHMYIGRTWSMVKTRVKA